MGTPSRSEPVIAHAPTHFHTESFGRALLRRAMAAMSRLQASAEERRVRQHLATLPDNLLRDIGIAEDEIHRIRAGERFTPRAWAERLGGRPLFFL